MATHPEVLWAQRSSSTDDEKNTIFLTVNLPDIDEKTMDMKLSDTSISFKATAGTPATGLKDYEFAFVFFAEIVSDATKKSLTSRHLSLELRKKVRGAEYWVRLTKEKKNPYVRTDFGKWVDEDEQEGEPDKIDEGFSDPIGDMGGGMGGMGGMDFEKMMATMGSAKPGQAAAQNEDNDDDDDDDDDDGPPPLEDVA